MDQEDMSLLPPIKARPLKCHKRREFTHKLMILFLKKGKDLWDKVFAAT